MSGTPGDVARMAGAHTVDSLLRDMFGTPRRTVEGEMPLLDELLAAPEVAAHLDRAALERLLDPASYLGLAGLFVDRVLGRATEPRDSGTKV